MIRKNVTRREHSYREQTENRESNYRGHSITIPMERRVEQANKIQENVIFHISKLEKMLQTDSQGTEKPITEAPLIDVTIEHRERANKYSNSSSSVYSSYDSLRSPLVVANFIFF